jgi:hypothetical protein
MKKKNLFILDPGANSADSVQIQRLMTKYRLPRLSIHCANRARICKRLRSLGIDSASLCSLADQYDNHISQTVSRGIDSWALLNV